MKENFLVGHGNLILDGHLLRIVITGSEKLKKELSNLQIALNKGASKKDSRHKISNLSEIFFNFWDGSPVSCFIHWCGISCPLCTLFMNKQWLGLFCIHLPLLPSLLPKHHPKTMIICFETLLKALLFYFNFPHTSFELTVNTTPPNSRICILN